MGRTELRVLDTAGIVREACCRRLSGGVSSGWGTDLKMEPEFGSWHDSDIATTAPPESATEVVVKRTNVVLAANRWEMNDSFRVSLSFWLIRVRRGAMRLIQIGEIKEKTVWEAVQETAAQQVAEIEQLKRGAATRAAYYNRCRMRCSSRKGVATDPCARLM